MWYEQKGLNEREIVFVRIDVSDGNKPKDLNVSPFHEFFCIYIFFYWKVISPNFWHFLAGFFFRIRIFWFLISKLMCFRWLAILQSKLIEKEKMKLIIGAKIIMTISLIFWSSLSGVWNPMNCNENWIKARTMFSVLNNDRFWLFYLSIE